MIFTFIAIFLKSVRLDPRSDMAFNCDETAKTYWSVNCEWDSISRVRSVPLISISLRRFNMSFKSSSSVGKLCGKKQQQFLSKGYRKKGNHLRINILLFTLKNRTRDKDWVLVVTSLVFSSPRYAFEEFERNCICFQLTIESGLRIFFK